MPFECPFCGNDQYFKFKTQNEYKLKPDISGKYHASLEDSIPYQGTCGECSEELPQKLLRDIFNASEIMSEED